MKVWKNLRWLGALLALAVLPASAGEQRGADIPGLPGPVLRRLASAMIAHPGPPMLREVKIHTDNDAAFRAKLDVVQTARRATDPAQRHLRLAYYIFADDESASKLQTELVAAARDGVKVDLLVDLWTNYADLDRFRMLEREANRGSTSGGGLTVRFYGRPSRNLMLDAAWIGSGCGEALKAGFEGGQVKATECARLKAPKIDAFVAEAEASPEARRLRALNLATWNTGGSGAFLAALYAKDGGALATAVLEGEALTLQSAGGSAAPSADQKAQLLKFAKLVRNAKLAADPFARIGAMAQLDLAFLLYGKKVNPIYNVFTGIFPIETKRVKAYRTGGGADRVNDDRDFATEFTHHKLILAGGKHWVVDGRNVDNAYNMGPNALSGRITFIDTSVEAKVIDSNAEMIAAFDRLFGFEEMVIGLDDLLRAMPNDVLGNAALTHERCAQQVGHTAWNKKDPTIAQALSACVDAAGEEEETHTYPLDERLDHYRDHMLARSAAWEAYAQASKSPAAFPTFEMSIEERNLATVAFVENLPYTRDSYHRTYGADVTGPKPRTPGEDGKNIHEVLIRGMEQACLDRAADKGGRDADVILYNAYFSPPSVLLRAMSQMVDGTWDCGGVNLTILTNSPATTDLRGVNLLGNEQMAAFEAYRRRFDGSPRAAKVRFLSLDKAKLDAKLVPPEKRDSLSPEPTTVSLHSKVAILGPGRLLVGSANADFRSYMMDTNDAIYLQDAPELVGRFTAWLKSEFIDDPTTQLVNDAPDTFGDAAATRLANLNALLLDVQKYGLARAADPSLPMTVVPRGEGWQVTNCADGRVTCAALEGDYLSAVKVYLDNARDCAIDTVDGGKSTVDGGKSTVDGGKSTVDGGKTGERHRSTCRTRQRASRSDRARRESQQVLDDFFKTI